jgi:hypothetical protein
MSEEKNSQVKDMRNYKNISRRNDENVFKTDA